MLDQIKAVLAETVNVNPEDVVLSARLNEDLDIDSLAAVELSLELETAFNIEIEDEELAALKTVEDIVKLLEKKTA